MRSYTRFSEKYDGLIRLEFHSETTVVIKTGKGSRGYLIPECIPSIVQEFPEFSDLFQDDYVSELNNLLFSIY